MEEKIENKKLEEKVEIKAEEITWIDNIDEYFMYQSRVIMFDGSETEVNKFD